MRIERMLSMAVLGVTLGVAGCSSEEAAAANEPAQTATPVSESPVAAAAPSGNVIEVKMVSEGASNYFEPAEITVQPGDVVRFVLVSGVHNVSFPSAGNAGATSLPGPSPFLATPGQSYDVAVDMPAGEYAFQCDPHVTMGMVGRLTVE